MIGSEIVLRKTTTSVAGSPVLASFVKVSLPANTTRARTISKMPRILSVIMLVMRATGHDLLRNVKSERGAETVTLAAM
jgi:hypothetical protein